MAKITELREKANELLEKANKIEEQNIREFGKYVVALIKEKKVVDTTILAKAAALGLGEVTK